jgi:hypothetical protein
LPKQPLWRDIPILDLGHILGDDGRVQRAALNPGSANDDEAAIAAAKKLVDEPRASSI